jgi:hypothetical protein
MAELEKPLQGLAVWALKLDGTGWCNSLPCMTTLQAKGGAAGALVVYGRRGAWLTERNDVAHIKPTLATRAA